MRVGVSLSPGGLLLPYHLGVMDGLRDRGVYECGINPIAGASAGAIAACSTACGIDSRRVLDATIDISDTTSTMAGGARGNLLPLLREKLADFVGPEQYETARTRPLAIAYHEVFPNFRPVHQTHFRDPQDLINAVCHSSMFPFFSTNWPVAFCRDTRRFVVDGFFAVPRHRFGCPDFDLVDDADKIGPVDETITVSVFPKELIGMKTKDEYTISPSLGLADDDDDAGDVDPQAKLTELFRLATQSSSAKELIGVYDSGYQDAERWYRKHQKRQEQIVREQREQERRRQEQDDEAVVLEL